MDPATVTAIETGITAVQTDLGTIFAAVAIVLLAIFAYRKVGNMVKKN